jgi:hypothetical protein
VRPTGGDDTVTDSSTRPPVAWAELRELGRRAREAHEAAKAVERASRAEGFRAAEWWAAERLRRRDQADERIRAALRAGANVRAICRDLKVGPNRVCRLRAQLVSSHSSSSG